MALELEIVTGSRAGGRVTLEPPASIGRTKASDLCLDDLHLSGQHGRFHARDGNYYYVDCGSSNGSTHVRGEERTLLDHRCPEVELWDGDILRLGDPSDAVIIRVHVREGETPTGEVVAVRVLREVEAYTDRITAQPARLGLLYRAATELGRKSDLEGVFETTANLIFELLPQATHLAIALRETGGKFPVVMARDRKGGHVDIPVSRTLIRRVLEDQAGLLLTNAVTELGGPKSVLTAGIASTLGVPLWTGDEIRGVLQTDNRDKPGLFNAADLELCTVACSHVSFAIENARLVARLRTAERDLEGQNAFLRRRAAGAGQSEILGRSRAVADVLLAIEKVRNTRVPVLIQGETGTGKELVARSIHYSSVRAEALLVAQNCTALPENLLESELFGHVKGAFTGADRDKKGLFEHADGGTIFLDEVGEMPPPLQAKLLRVLQEGEIWPIGAPRPKRVDVRVVSATHRDLEAMVKDGGFRQDLFYRLHVFPIRVPPLRERREDIAMLARHFLELYSKEFGRAVTSFSAEATERLAAYEWPGNVRELQNEIQRVLINKTKGDVVMVEDLTSRLLGETGIVDDPRIPQGNLKDMMDGVERVLLARTLRETNGNKTQAAQNLGITREGLHKKLARFGMKSSPPGGCMGEDES